MIQIKIFLKEKQVGTISVKNSDLIENTDEPIVLELEWEDNEEIKELFSLSFSESYYLYGHSTPSFEEISEDQFECPSLNDLEEALLGMDYFSYTKENFPKYQASPISGEDSVIF